MCHALERTVFPLWKSALEPCGGAQPGLTQGMLDSEALTKCRTPRGDEEVLGKWISGLCQKSLSGAGEASGFLTVGESWGSAQALKFQAST